MMNGAVMGKQAQQPPPPAKPGGIEDLAQVIKTRATSGIGMQNFLLLTIFLTKKGYAQYFSEHALLYQYLYFRYFAKSFIVILGKC